MQDGQRKARTMKVTEAQNKQLQKQKEKGSSHGKFPCTSTYFLFCHCFVATTALTHPRRGQKALSSRKTADSDASDDGKEFTSKQLQ